MKFSCHFINPVNFEEQFRNLTDLEREIIGVLRKAERWEPFQNGSNLIVDKNLASKLISKFILDREAKISFQSNVPEVNRS